MTRSLFGAEKKLVYLKVLGEIFLLGIMPVLIHWSGFLKHGPPHTPFSGLITPTFLATSVPLRSSLGSGSV